MDKLNGTLSSINQINGGLNTPTKIYPPSYTGSVEVTPSQETQILYTSGLMVNENITVNPIPSNYGLITWNGSTLTVS